MSWAGVLKLLCRKSLILILRMKYVCVLLHMLGSFIILSNLKSFLCNWSQNGESGSQNCSVSRGSGFSISSPETASSTTQLITTIEKIPHNPQPTTTATRNHDFNTWLTFSTHVPWTGIAKLSHLVFSISFHVKTSTSFFKPSKIFQGESY